MLDPTIGQVYVLEGEIIGPNTDVLRKITRFATDRTKVEIDCGRLRRMDFVSAGTLFNIVSQLHTQGRLVVFNHVLSPNRFDEYAGYLPMAERIEATRRPATGRPAFSNAEWQALRNVCK